MSAADRWAYVLYCNGLTYREIGARLDVTSRRARELVLQNQSPECVAALGDENLRLRGQAGDMAEKVTHAASDLQPVVALIDAGGVLDDSARSLIRRAFDTLAALTVPTGGAS